MGGLLFCQTLNCMAQTTLRVSPEAEDLFHEADSLKALFEDDAAAEKAGLAASFYGLDYGKESMEYAMALERIVPYLFPTLYDWKTPLRKGLYVIQQAKGTQCDEYAKLLTTFAHYESNFDDSLARMDFAHQAVDIRKKVLGTQHPDYAHSLSVLAECYADGHHYDEAITLYKEAVAVLREHEATHAQQLGMALDNLETAYRLSERHDEAIACLEELLELKTRILGQGNKSTINTMSRLVSYYRHVGDELKAYQLQNEINQLTSQAEIDSSDTFYEQHLSDLAYAYEAQGRFDLAIPLCERILDIRKNYATRSGHEPSFVDSMYIAQASTRLANCCLSGREYSKAIDAANEACDIWASYGMNKDTTYVELLNTIATCYSRCQMDNYAGAFARKGMSILEESEDGTDNLTYAKSLRIQALYLFQCGEMEEAAELLSQALDIIGRHQGKVSSPYAYCLQQMAKIQASADMPSEANRNYNEAMAIIKQLVLQDFSTKSPQERQTTWKLVEHLFVDTYPQFIIGNGFYRDNKETAGLLYDYSALFAKGLLLSAETSITDIVRRTGNQELMAQLSDIQEKREQLERFYQNPNAEQANEATQLSRQIEQGEKELLLKLKQAGVDYTGMLQTTWRDIRDVLREQDIAVEFITFNSTFDDPITAAITLRSNDEYPQVHLLFGWNVLEDIDMDDIYDPATMFYDVVWGPLYNRLDGVQNVYFSPSGILHSLGIENLPGCEDMNFYRLSSTRELVAHHGKGKVKQAALYGGLYYDVEPDEMETESHRYASDTRKAYQASDRSIAGDIVGRGAAAASLPYLEGTADEVDAISMLTKEKNIKTATFTGNKGNEESFKGLSGNDIQLLHIATHGFYWNEEKKDDNTASDIDFGEYRRSKEDKALSRSGLLMSGAENALLGSLPNGVEDGVLTAQEIAQLDLSSLELVVLSACETALGEVSKSEGVFGLQRGFKKAGAQSIIMSLWKVDDEATSLLMKEFYGNWLGGATKHEALEQAKAAVKAHEEKGWDNPKYWAAFILLDGNE